MVRVRSLACVALVALSLSVGCNAAAQPAPTAGSVSATAPPPPAPTLTTVQPTVTVPPPTATALPPTLTPAPPTRTPVPPTSTPEPTATPAPTLTAAQHVQQGYCDKASPPGHVPLPPTGLTVLIPLPDVATLPPAVANGPHDQGIDAAPHVTAPSVAVVDEASGELMYSVNPFERRAPASITKIANVIVALERGPEIHTMFTTTVSASALVPCDGSSVMGLEPDDHVKLETLLYGMMLPSGNDAAEQVAYSLAGSRERYVDWMNEKVRSLHLTDTHFVTPSGMDADGHYSSAYDMAMLGRYAMQNPEFRALAATQSIVSDDYYMHNLNPLLGVYPGTDGVKIGYTDIAGRTIVASATRDGHRVYVSLMGSRNLAGDCTALFDWVWKDFTW
jgi:D-alanyl-D-alanine carboxypeptidase